jgi:O-antigen/teichoic acid export membrane protein
MNTARRVAKNTAVLLTSQAIGKILHFVLVIFVARYLGAAAFGKYAFAISFTILFSVLADMGLNILITREIARDKSKADIYLGTALIIKAILALITLVAIIMAVNLMHYPSDTIIVVYIAAFALMLNTLASTLATVYQAFERMEYGAMVNVSVGALALGLTLLAISLGYGLYEIMIVYLLQSIANLALNAFIVLKKLAKPKFVLDRKLGFNLLKAAIPMGLAGIFVTIYYRIDTVMLSAMKGDVVVGWYNAAYNLIFGLMFIPAAFNTAIFPVLSRLRTTSMNSLRMVYERSFKYLFCVGLPIAVGVTLLAKRIILPLYGEEYINAAEALQILIWALFFIFVNGFLNSMLVATDQQKRMAYIVAGAAILNVILNVFLIPALSYKGAAIATVSAEVSYFVFSSLVLSKSIAPSPLFKVYKRPLLAILIMGAFIVGAKPLPILVLIPLAATVYMAILLIMRFFDREDRSLLKQIFTKGMLKKRVLQSSERKYYNT